MDSTRGQADKVSGLVCHAAGLTSRLKVALLGVTSLEKSWAGKQAPYCELKLGDCVFRSQVHTGGGTEPECNQAFTFDDVVRGQELHIQVFNGNPDSPNTAIRSRTYAVEEVCAKRQMEACLALQTRDGGLEGWVVCHLEFQDLHPAMPMPISAAAAAGRLQLMRGPVAAQQASSVLPRPASNEVWQAYSRDGLLCRGPTGTLYLGHRRASGEAVKMLVVSKTSKDLPDVQREVSMLRHLEGHPHIVVLKEVCEDQQSMCLVMEPCLGGELLHGLLRRGSMYTERDVAQAMRAILQAVAHCHAKGVVHRDLKLESFSFTDLSPRAVLKLTSFRHCTFYQEGEQLNERVGAAFYRAPDHSCGQEGDMWSCGIILYILLCGSPPFRFETQPNAPSWPWLGTLKLISPEWNVLSAPAQDCVRRLLEKDPKERATAAEMLHHEWLQEDSGRTASTKLQPLQSCMRKLARLAQLRKDGLKAMQAKHALTWSLEDWATLNIDVEAAALMVGDSLGTGNHLDFTVFGDAHQQEAHAREEALSRQLYDHLARRDSTQAVGQAGSSWASLVSVARSPPSPSSSLQTPANQPSPTASSTLRHAARPIAGSVPVSALPVSGGSSMPRHAARPIASSVPVSASLAGFTHALLGSVGGWPDEHLRAYRKAHTDLLKTCALQLREKLGGWWIDPQQLELGRMVGQGGFAVVLQAKQAPGGQQVALKQFHVHTFMGRTRVQSFVKEVCLLSQLKHKNIIRMQRFTANLEDGWLGIVLEWAGDSLAAKLADETDELREQACRLAAEQPAQLPETEVAQHVITPQQRLEWAIGVAEGLQYLHGRDPCIVHRDLTIQNILIDQHGQVKLIDFGISQLLTHTHLTLNRAGCPAWMAPELLRGEERAKGHQVFSLGDKKSDIYSLGLCLCAMATHCQPWEGHDAELAFRDGARLGVPDVPQPWLQQLIRQCLSETPDRRPAIEEVLRELRGHRAEGMLRAPVSTAPGAEEAAWPVYWPE